MVTFERAFIRTNMSKAVEHSFDLLEKGGYIHQESAGSFTFMPLGQKIIDNISKIIDQEMDNVGALKISMPTVQTADIWKKSGRWDVYGNEMLKGTNRDGREFCVAPTHEEQVTHLMKDLLTSPKDLPVILYQTGMKYRDELRPRHGLLRTREFIMTDAYSFDRTAEELDNSYQLVRGAFLDIYKQIGLEIYNSEAETAQIGGKFSEEFLAPASFGEDEIIYNGKHMKAIEAGHIFKLGTKYSQAYNLESITNEERNLVEMGCYGIGTSRLIPALVDQHQVGDGIVWPMSVAPYHVSIITTNSADEEQKKAAQQTHDVLIKEGYRAILDDRKKSAGKKFADADLIGAPYQIIVGKKIDTGNVEIKDRIKDVRTDICLNNISNYFRK